MDVDKDLLDKLPEKYRDKIHMIGTDTGVRAEVTIDPEDVCAVVRAVKDAGYDHFLGITVIDYPDKGVFELVYLISSVKKKARLVAVRTSIPRDNPIIDSIHLVYPLAYYQEIEAYEFFGVRFRNHNGLRKFILEGNWQGPPPLRKDVDTRKIVLNLYYGGKRYERPVQWRSLGGYSKYSKTPSGGGSK
jgi:NADH:ubiquinone oxidoreductase subunit C